MRTKNDEPPDFVTSIEQLVYNDRAEVTSCTSDLNIIRKISTDNHKKRLEAFTRARGIVKVVEPVSKTSG